MYAGAYISTELISVINRPCRPQYDVYGLPYLWDQIFNFEEIWRTKNENLLIEFSVNKFVFSFEYDQYNTSWKVFNKYYLSMKLFVSAWFRLETPDERKSFLSNTKHITLIIDTNRKEAVMMIISWTWSRFNVTRSKITLYKLFLSFHSLANINSC